MEILKKGAVSMKDTPAVVPMSIHNKSLQGDTDNDGTTPMSFHKKKEFGASDLRPFDYRADQKLSKA